MWANNFDGIKINIIVNEFLFSLFCDEEKPEHFDI